MTGIVLGRNFQRWLTLLRISIGIIYTWFGTLKFFPGISPAEGLAQNTIVLLTFGFISKTVIINLLALWETAMGILMITGLFNKLTIKLVFIHMIFTFSPLVLLPGTSFTQAPYGLTLVGQYILKNIVIISALLLINSVSFYKEAQKK